MVANGLSHPAPRRWRGCVGVTRSPIGPRSRRTAGIDAHQLASRVVQMIRDYGHGRLGIARTNGLIEREMLLVIFGDALRSQNLVLHGVPLSVRAHGLDLTIDPDHERIAGCFRNQLMEFLIP